MNLKTRQVLWKKSIPAFSMECHLMGNIALMEKGYWRREIRRLEVWDLYKKKRLWVEKIDFWGDFLPEWRAKGIYLPSNSGLFFVDAKSGERIKVINKIPYHGDSLGTNKIAFLFREKRGDFVIVFDSEGNEINRIDPKIVVKKNYELSACSRKIVTAETEDELHVFKLDGTYVGSCKERLPEKCLVTDNKIFVLNSRTLKCYENGEKIWEYKPSAYLMDVSKEAVVISNSKNTLLLNPEK